MASATVDTLITKYVLDDSDHHRGALRVVTDTGKVSAAQNKVRQSTSDVNRGFADFTRTMSMGMTVAAAFATTMFAMGAAILKVAFDAASKAAEFEALENGLKAVSASAAEARQNLQDLKDIAKLPGVDIEGAVKGFSKLRFAGVSADQSKEIITQSGNANAIAGGGRQELESILRAFSQIASTEFLKGQELLQLGDAGLPAVAWIKAAFGTADTEKLKKAGVDSKMVLEAITYEMQNLQRASGGAKNQLENLAIAADQAEISFGKGIIDGLFGGMDILIHSIEDVTDSGVFRYLGETIASDIGSALGVFDASDLRTTMVKAGAGVVELSAHIRNFVLNVKESAKLLDPIYIASFGITSTQDLFGKASGLNGQLDPSSEAERWEENALAMIAAQDRASAKRRVEKEAEEAQRKSQMEAGRADFEQRRQGARDALSALDDKPLKKIADNTRRTAMATEKMLQQYESTILGGSELGKMGLSAREIKSVRNGTGGGPQGEIQQAVDLIYNAALKAVRGGMAAQHSYAK